MAQWILSFLSLEDVLNDYDEVNPKLPLEDLLSEYDEVKSEFPRRIY